LSFANKYYVYVPADLPAGIVLKLSRLAELGFVLAVCHSYVIPEMFAGCKVAKSNVVL
jgi:hypothetical protein